METVISFDSIKLQNQSQVISFIAILGMLASLVLFFLNIAIYKENWIDHIILIMNFVLFSISLCYQYFTKKLTLPKIITFLVTSILMPIRIYGLEKTFAYETSWIPICLIANFYIVPRPFFVISAIIWTTLAAYSSFFMHLFPLDILNLEAISMHGGLGHIASLIFLVAFLYFIHKCNKQISQEFSKLERLKTSRKIAVTAAHKILNPLSIISMNLQRLSNNKNQMTQENIDKMLEACSRISSAMQTFKEIEDINDLSTQAYLDLASDDLMELDPKN